MNDVLSGPLASYGQSFLAQARAAVDYVNKSGGVNGHQVRLETADSAATGQNASAAAQQLINADKVSAMLGFTLSDDCSTVGVLVATRKVPIVCTSTPGKDLKPVKPYTFAGNDVELQEISGTVDFVQKDLKLGSGTKFAILDSSPLGVQAWAKKLTSELQGIGFTSVAHETIPVTAVNGNTQISKIVSARPDVVFAEPVASQYQPLLAALRASGSKAAVISAHNGVGYAGLTTIKDPDLYSITTTEYITDLAQQGDGAQAYIKGLTGVGLGTPKQMNNVIGPPGFLSTYGVTKALGACGYPCNGEKLAKAMESTSFPFEGLVSGNYGWTSDLHSPYQQLFIYGYDAASGQPKVVKRGVVTSPVTD